MPEITKTVEQIERERLTRRQALRKLGFGAGLSAFLLLGVDDLARMVGAEMQKRAGDNQVAEQIAKEFQSAGVAFASPSNPSGPTCQHCCDQQFNDLCYCVYMYGEFGENPNPTTLQHCENQAGINYSACVDAHCTSPCSTPSGPCGHFLKPPQGCNC